MLNSKRILAQVGEMVKGYVGRMILLHGKYRHFITGRSDDNSHSLGFVVSRWYVSLFIRLPDLLWRTSRLLAFVLLISGDPEEENKASSTNGLGSMIRPHSGFLVSVRATLISRRLGSWSSSLIQDFYRTRCISLISSGLCPERLRQIE